MNLKSLLAIKTPLFDYLASPQILCTSSTFLSISTAANFPQSLLAAFVISAGGGGGGAVVSRITITLIITT